LAPITLLLKVAGFGLTTRVMRGFELVEIGSHNMFGPDVYITDSNHRFGPGLKPNEQPMQAGKVKIGDCCWIGAKVVILKDVELGDGCVVGAGSVVTKSVEAGTVVAGVPAQRLLQNVSQPITK
jgi:acetyltransferase-like isoleucine patch superfamily enzyme